VTVNQRFALFFPEKRPFFLEGIELFSTSNQLVYTRQIVNPLVGAKVTGKFGNFGVAYLAAVDKIDEDGDGDDDDVLFNVTRLRRDFGSNFESATSGEESEPERRERIFTEEEGGPFVRTRASQEFAYDLDESNIAEATREPLPRTSVADP
jgi:hypothetical protein